MMLLPTLALVWLGVAHAQSCSCSVGGSDSVAPSGPSPSAGAIVLALDYGIAQTGSKNWRASWVVERDGNSMEGMDMPGHVVQTLRGSVVVGTGKGVSVSVGAPGIFSHPLGHSDMFGDVDAHFLGDVTLGLKWGHTWNGVYAGLGGGLSLPTGRVLANGGVRGGRGSLGMSARAEVLDTLTPHVVLGGALSAAWSTYPAPKDDYVVGLNASASAGVRLFPREQGRTRFDEFLVLVEQGNDRRGAEILDQTGLTALSFQSAFWWRVWAQKERSVSLTVRGQIPIVQIIGDPWLEQDWSISGGVTAAVL